MKQNLPFLQGKPQNLELAAMSNVDTQGNYDLGNFTPMYAKSPGVTSTSFMSPSGPFGN